MFIHHSLRHAPIFLNALFTFITYETSHLFNMDEYGLESERLMRKAIDLFNDEEWIECAAITYALSDRRLSLWQQIHCHILLASAVEDWDEGEVMVFVNHRGR